jgi:hypothetical protein
MMDRIFRNAEEAEAAQITINHCIDLVSWFERRKIDDRPGLIKCILRASLFAVEEMEAGRQIDRETLIHFIIEEFRNDKNRGQS